MLHIGVIGILSGVAFASIGRALDLLSTWWLTPNLKFESNTLIKKFGWGYAVVGSVIFPTLGYVVPAGGVALGVMSCVFAFSNLRQSFVLRNAPEAEDGFRALATSAFRSCTFYRFCIESALSAAPIAILAIMVLVSNGATDIDYAACIAYGLLAWCVVAARLRLATWVRVQHRLRAAAG